jgi:hypothetical protein
MAIVGAKEVEGTKIAIGTPAQKKKTRPPEGGRYKGKTSGVRGLRALRIV